MISILSCCPSGNVSTFIFRFVFFFSFSFEKSFWFLCWNVIFRISWWVWFGMKDTKQKTHTDNHIISNMRTEYTKPTAIDDIIISILFSFYFRFFWNLELFTKFSFFARFLLHFSFFSRSVVNQSDDVRHSSLSPLIMYPHTGCFPFYGNSI